MSSKQQPGLTGIKKIGYNYESDQNRGAIFSEHFLQDIFNSPELRHTRRLENEF